MDFTIVTGYLNQFLAVLWPIAEWVIGIGAAAKLFMVVIRMLFR